MSLKIRLKVPPRMAALSTPTSSQTPPRPSADRASSSDTNTATNTPSNAGKRRTRPSNADKHPGAVVWDKDEDGVPQPPPIRKSKAERDAAKAKALREEEAALRAIDKLRRQIAVEEEASDDETADLHDQAEHGEEQVNANSCAVTRPAQWQSRKDDHQSVGYDEFGEDRDPSDDFDPDAERPEDSDESDNIMDIDDMGVRSRSSGSAKQKKPTTRKERGAAVRAKVNTTMSSGSVRRKADNAVVRGGASGSTAHQGGLEKQRTQLTPRMDIKGGLKANWQKHVPVVGGGRSKGKVVPKAQSEKAAKRDIAEQNVVGGIGEEDDVIEVKFAGAKRRRNGTGPDARQSRTNKALPFSTVDWETYETLFMSSVKGWVGSLDNSFSLGPSDGFTNLLQDLVDHFFPKYNIVVDPKAPIYRNTSQRIYEWRHMFATAATAAVRGEMQKYNTLEARADHASAQIDAESDTQSPFLYLDPEAKRGAYRTEVILKTYLPHYEVLQECPIELDDPPKGAMAMATAAVERAYGFWTTGTEQLPTNGTSPFAGNTCGGRVRFFAKSTRKLSKDVAWVKINTGCEALLEEHGPSKRPRKRMRRSHEDSEEDNDDDDDAIVVDDSPLAAKDTSMYD
ncbi:hypothetical protein EV121DRAFT_289012 [Schizophyllum commune]